MKHNLVRSAAAKARVTVLAAFCFSAVTHAQTSQPLFGCPDVYVIAYKQGTNCTPATYSIRTMTLAGMMNTEIAATDTAHELNALGLNGQDGFLYGMRYHRYVAGSSCAFNNTKLVRYDAAGAFDSLGVIAPPPGGTVTTAIGMVGMPNKYVFFARDSVNALMIGMIYRIDTQTRSNDTLLAEYRYLTNNCSGKSYADFAVNPSNGKLYAYGIYNDGTIKGTVLELDPNALTISCVGTPETSAFTSASSNFGGIMFGNDGFMYGVDIFTKKFYKIDAGTGAVTYIATIPTSTSQIRADLGSCAYGTAPLVLPVGLVSFNGERVANGGAKLQWVTEDGAFAHCAVEASEDGRLFSPQADVPLPAKHYDGGRAVYQHFDAKASRYYRLKLHARGGNIAYSAVVDLAGEVTPFFNQIILAPNPARGAVTLAVPESYRQGSIKMLDAMGCLVYSSALTGNAKHSIRLEELPHGVYTVHIRLDEKVSTKRLVVAP